MRLVTVRVKPSSRAPGVRIEGAEFTIAVREPARNGLANEAARRALAEQLGVPQSRVRLVRGAAARVKTFAVDDA